MTQRPYTLGPDEKVTPVMIGTASTLVWGELVTKTQARISAYLNTLAEDFVPIHDARILFLAPTEQVPPVERPVLYVRLEEILLLFSPAEVDAPPEESGTLHYEPVEIVVGSFLVEGMFMKSPQADLHNLLLVSNVPYMDFYRATIRHVAKLWLGTFSANRVQIRRDRLFLAPR